jgi:hypothetical protein
MRKNIPGSSSLASLCLAGCIVRERTVVARPAPCRHAVWVDGHYGVRGYWHPGYCRCGRRVVVGD